MQFIVAITIDAVSDFAEKTVDTETGLQRQLILACERWILAGGGIRRVSNVAPSVGLTQIHSDESSAILQFEIEGQIQVILLLLSGVDSAQDSDTAQRFREYCTQINANIAHDAFQLAAPTAYAVGNPLRDDLHEGLVTEMIVLCDHLSAALLNLRGCPI